MEKNKTCPNCRNQVTIVKNGVAHYKGACLGCGATVRWSYSNLCWIWEGTSRVPDPRMDLSKLPRREVRR